MHLFDFDGDLYGRNLRIALIEYLRPERKFAGLEALNSYRKQIGLVLLDAALPGVTPDKMLAAVRSVGGEIPVAICTDDSVSEAKSKFTAVTGVLRKPIRTDRLLAVVRKAMGIE